jgi:hypothetical protein
LEAFFGETPVFTDEWRQLQVDACDYCTSFLRPDSSDVKLQARFEPPIKFRKNLFAGSQGQGESPTVDSRGTFGRVISFAPFARLWIDRLFLDCETHRVAVDGSHGAR